MNCGEVRTLAPLYLSGEIGPDQRGSFAAHLASCPECEHEIERQRSLDARLLSVLGTEPGTARLEHNVRRRIQAEQSRRGWAGLIAAVAAVLLAMVGIHALLRPTSASGFYTAAARDHWTEVVEHQPRHWRSGTAEIQTLAAQNGLSSAQVTALAPAGYWLEHAKTCGLDGRPALHFVFTNGTQQYSLYVLPHRGGKEAVRVVQRNSEQVAGFETGQFRAFLVTVGSPAECEQLARLTAARL